MLLTGDERITEDPFNWTHTLLDRGDPAGNVDAAWMAKELLRDVYHARDETHARRVVVSFSTWCAGSDLAELRRIATTISSWSVQVFAYHCTGKDSNGRVENTHMLAEQIRHNATDSPITTTTPDDSLDAPEQPGILNQPHEYEDDHHAPPSRAGLSHLFESIALHRRVLSRRPSAE